MSKHFFLILERFPDAGFDECDHQNRVVINAA
jgi:hypothetical protein